MRAWLLFAVGFITLGLDRVEAAPPVAGPAQLGTFVRPDGESFFVLGLAANLPSPESRPMDVVIFYDTSASQTAIFREKGLAVLDALLEDLGPDDKAKLYAIDIDAVPLTENFVGPRSAEMKAALTKLRKRTPLGATDMAAALEASITAFGGDKAKPAPNRAALYLGDGMSAANILFPDKLEKTLARMVELRIPFSSYAIGPRLDVELLGALANHTGGNTVVDFPDKPARNFARDLSATVHGAVFWPKKATLPPAIVEAFPKTTPPLRSDREMILLGRGKLTEAFEVQMAVEHAGQTSPLVWKVEPVKPTSDHAPLVDLVERCKQHKGLVLATAGRGGLIESYRALNKNVRNLIELAKTALKTQNADQAELLAKKALESDPTNPDAKAVLSAVDKFRKSPDAPKSQLPKESPPGGGLKIEKDKPKAADPAPKGKEPAKEAPKAG
jgi:hypothetical protein